MTDLDLALGIAVLAVGTAAVRASGPLLRSRIPDSARVDHAMSTLVVALFAGLVATATVFEAGEFAGWARVTGVAVGGVLAWRRAPFLVVVVTAAVVTALMRRAGVA